MRKAGTGAVESARATARPLDNSLDRRVQTQAGSKSLRNGLQQTQPGVLSGHVGGTSQENSSLACCSPVSTPAASCCRPFATPAIWIIGWSSSAIAAPTQMERCMQCCSTSSSRSRRPSSPRRSSPVPCLAGLHERTRAIDLEKRRHSVTNPFARRFDPRALRLLHKTGMPVTGGGRI